MLLIYYVNRYVSTARTRIPIVAIKSGSRSMGLSDIVWVDGRYGSPAKTRIKHAMQFKLAGSIYGILSVILI